MRSSSPRYVHLVSATNAYVSQLLYYRVNKSSNGLNSRTGLKFVAAGDLCRRCDVALCTCWPV